MNAPSTLTAPFEVEQAVTNITPAIPDTYGSAITAIMEELDCSRNDAAVGMEFIGRMVDSARIGARNCDTPGIHHLEWEEMHEPGYAVMDRVMEHGVTAMHGTAHAAIEKHFLLPEEFGLVHDNPTGEPEDCMVTLGVRRMV